MVTKQELKRKIRELEKLLKKTTYLTKAGILERDNYTCSLCGEKNTVLNVHHIMPMEFGGEKRNPDNILTLCKGCHLFMHCNPKLIMKEKINHRIRTKEGMEKAIGVGKRGRDKKPRKSRGGLKVSNKHKKKMKLNKVINGRF
ncbi:MAG TPA: HNH endonuclease [Candidatus Paceibacterota bacterium]|nr:HNH endonuclease [Candidatus Paceibacterota bacterium]